MRTAALHFALSLSEVVVRLAIEQIKCRACPAIASPARVQMYEKFGKWQRKSGKNLEGTKKMLIFAASELVLIAWLTPSGRRKPAQMTLYAESKTVSPLLY